MKNEAMDLKERQEGCNGEFVGRRGREKRDYIIL